MQVTSVGKSLVFTDPDTFGKQADRTAFHDAMKTNSLEKDLCKFGFDKIRIQAANKQNSGEEYDLGCRDAERHKDPKDTKDTKDNAGKPKDESGIPLYLRRPPATETSPDSTKTTAGGPGAISGKVFLITKGGDLKPARLAQVILLYGGVLGGSHDSGTASIFYYNKKGENMKASWPSPGHPVTCESDLLLFNSTLKSTLQWGLTTGKATAQIQITTSDEEGAFQFPQVPIGEYTILAWGHAGANDAYWEESLKVEPGQSVGLKLSSPHVACLRVN